MTTYLQSDRLLGAIDPDELARAIHATLAEHVRDLTGDALPQLDGDDVFPAAVCARALAHFAKTGEAEDDDGADAPRHAWAIYRAVFGGPAAILGSSPDSAPGPIGVVIRAAIARFCIGAEEGAHDGRVAPVFLAALGVAEAEVVAALRGAGEPLDADGRIARQFSRAWLQVQGVPGF